MRSAITLLLSVAVALPAIAQNPPRSVRPGALQLAKPRKPRPLTPEVGLRVRWPVAAQISPDGSTIALAIRDTKLDANGTETQLYLLPAAGGALRQLTFAGGSEPAWSPDGRKIAFTSGRDDPTQIFVLDLAGGGEARRLTSLVGGATGPVWSPDGSMIAFTSNVHPECRDDVCEKERREAKARSKVRARAYDELLYRHWSAWDEGTRSQIFVVPADGSEPPRNLTAGKLAAPCPTLNAGRGYAFAGDAALVYCANTEREAALSTNNDLFLVLTKGGEPRALTTNKALDANPTPSPDGRSIAYVAMARPGFEADRATLFIHDLRSSSNTPRSAGFDRSIEELVWMPDSSGLYVTAYNRGRKELFTVGRDAGEVAPVLPGVNLGLVSAGRGAIAFVGSSLRAPPEVFVIDSSSKQPRQVSHLNDALLEELELGRTEELEVDAKGRAIHGFVTYPPAFRPENRYPLVVLIHGGPQGAFTDAWHARWNAQLFAARGYVVAMPNFSGSIGYGQTFTDLVTKDWGGGPYDDVMAFTDVLANKSFVDERWMCAVGASYGGYLVNWIAGHTQRFRCLISHAGIFNLESMWGDTEELWYPEWEMGGPPWAARDTYRRWSPHEHIQNARTPALITHGALDFRVSLSHGQQMFTSLRRLGVPARFVHFPDEGHWITKPQNHVYWYNEMLGWLSRYLR